MADTRQRCDHCGKWKTQGNLVMPNTPEEYQDGRYGVCEKCAKKYDREYWTKWVEKKGDE